MTAFDLAELNAFYGSENLYRHPLTTKLKYTDGVQFLAAKAGAYWLIDMIAAHQIEPKVAAEDFQVWILKVTDDVGVVVCHDGNDNVIVETKIDYTDFPAPGIELYVSGGVLLLPQEY